MISFSEPYWVQAGVSTSYCLFSKELFQNIKNNLTTFPCNPSQVEQVQWNLYGKIICMCNYNVYESKFAKAKHKSETANSFCFLPGHFKYDDVCEKFTFEHLRSKRAWHLNKQKGKWYKALLKASPCSGVFSRTTYMTHKTNLLYSFAIIIL